MRTEITGRTIANGKNARTDKMAGYGSTYGSTMDRIFKSRRWEVYELNNMYGETYYEVIKRKRCCSYYPQDEEFGEWAWTFRNKEEAMAMVE